LNKIITYFGRFGLQKELSDRCLISENPAKNSKYIEGASVQFAVVLNWEIL